MSDTRNFIAAPPRCAHEAVRRTSTFVHQPVYQCVECEIERRLAASAAEIAALKAQKDGAYLERNRCVALIAQMAIALGLKAGKARTAIEGWSDDWHGCIYIDLPAGQVSWHYHDSQAFLFDALPAYEGKWDGHDTEEKYRRVGLPFESALRTQLEEARKDAERWQYWRDVYEVNLVCTIFGNGCINKRVEQAEAVIDAAIDAAKEPS